ncbi:MAG: glycosyltransferase [Phycisphaerales bacterium]|nr:glycosyltransferase [Phycisphaerales bacterium]
MSLPQQPVISAPAVGTVPRVTTEPRVGQGASPSTSIARRLRRWLLHHVLRTVMALYLLSLDVLGKLVPRRRRRARLRILATGKFHSDTWVTSFLKPMAASAECEGVWAVAAFPVRDIPGIHVVYPPRWLQRLCGQAFARLIVFTCMAIRLRPDLVGGFHLLLNGLAAGWMARLLGRRSFYVAVGGPMEILDGGLWSENALFTRMETPDSVVERRLVQAIGRMDRVVTMGTKAVQYYRSRGLTNDFHVIPGAIDAGRFRPGNEARQADIILVGRLVEIKRIDVLLEALALAAKSLPKISALIVGDGPLRAALERQASELGLDGQVRFTGQQSDVEAWYRRAKVFALTSDSEGLSLAMMEAMSCGLAPVVSDVGDLGDMIEEGVSGHLVPRRRAEVFAERFVALLSDEARLKAMSAAAQASAQRVAPAPSTQRWEALWRTTDSPCSAVDS